MEASPNPSRETRERQQRRQHLLALEPLLQAGQRWGAFRAYLALERHNLVKVLESSKDMNRILGAQEVIKFVDHLLTLEKTVQDARIHDQAQRDLPGGPWSEEQL